MKGSGLAPSPHLPLHSGSVGITGIHAVLTGGTVQGSPRDSQVTKKLRKWQALGQSLEAVELEITGVFTQDKTLPMAGPQQAGREKSLRFESPSFCHTAAGRSHHGSGSQSLPLENG